MDTAKPFYASKTVWGSGVAILSVLGQIAGHSIAPEEQLALVNLLTQGGELVGAALALYGRLTAKHSLS